MDSCLDSLAEQFLARGYLVNIRPHPQYIRRYPSRMEALRARWKGREGVTLEEDGAARFPDAPTERGVKHLRELQRAVEQGAEATAFFVIQMEGMRSFSPNDATHPAFGAALREAVKAGVHAAAWECAVTPDTLSIVRPVPVAL